ncbi:MAG TPA: FAD-dependent monooxygenase [Alloacidobacterium sp.]|nr:FAD-dependent monooxygenase [Alloacidobacterium sp.]
MQTDVLIVGAGPVGLVMAIELARYGVAVRIIDKAPERTDKSKALVIWSRSLELLERSGCSAALVDAGYKVTSVNITADKKPIAHLALDKVPTAYPYGLMLPQNETERVLDEFLNTLGVKIERTVELTHFTSSADSVVSTLRHADGSEETVETSWLIGCDGAHSTIRHQLGMEFKGDTLLIDWVIADIHLEGFPRTPEINIAWHSDGVLVTFPIAEDRYRIIADAGTAAEASAPPAPPTLEQVQAILDKRFPGGVRASNPIWLSAFRINERKIAEYRSGRVFLAGDAAHVHSPAGGQGMNTGMQDACNLAWKLALVVRGVGVESLLESYSAERSPIAEQVLKVTGRVTDMATLTGGMAQSLRNHVASLLLGLSPVRKLAADITSEISIGYPNSPLNAGHGLGHDTPAPGDRAPIRKNEPTTSAGNTPRFALFAKADGIPSDLLLRYANILEPTLREPFHPSGLWLVRPDGYTALAAKRGDWNAVTEYLDNISVNRTRDLLSASSSA